MGLKPTADPRDPGREGCLWKEPVPLGDSDQTVSLVSHQAVSTLLCLGHCWAPQAQGSARHTKKVCRIVTSRPLGLGYSCAPRLWFAGTLSTSSAGMARLARCFVPGDSGDAGQSTGQHGTSRGKCLLRVGVTVT